MRRLSRAFLPLLALALLAGCGGPRVVPVSGIVLIDGQPLPYGFVQVVPEGHRAAVGKIGPDGRFTLTTTSESDGCFIGTHPVAVVGIESLGPSSQKWHAPKEYAATDSSGLTATITGPTKDLKIDLSWKGGKPFIEKFNGE